METIRPSKHNFSRKKLLLIITASAVALGMLAALCLFTINIHIMSTSADMIISENEAEQIKADCIIVLGAAVRSDGSLSSMLHDRLKMGVSLFFAGASDRLLMSGDHASDDYDEVNAMKAYAVEQGVSSECVFMDHSGFSTYESIYRAKAIFKAEKIIIVTQGYHLPRALYVAQAFGLEAYGVSSDYQTYAGQRYRDLREFAARGKDFFTALIKPKPTHLGDAIPISGDGNITNDKDDYT